MQIYNYGQYNWNRCVGPHGNMGKVSPEKVAKECDKLGIPWYSDGCPYSSGIKVYCESNDIWNEIIKKSKLKY